MKGSMATDNENESKVPRLLTTKQLAKQTGIAYWRVLELVAKGKGPPHMRLGQTLRFPEDRLVEWIAEQTNNHKESV